MSRTSKFAVDDLVQNVRDDYSDKHLVPKTLPARSVGRVRRIFKMSNPDEYLVYVKFYGHPLMPFHESELQKVRVSPINTKKVAKPN